MGDLFNGAKSLVDYLQNIDKRVAEVVKTVTATYREANRSVRTEAIPNYFRETPTLKNWLHEDCYILIFQNIEQMVSDARKKLDTMRTKTRETLASLYAEVGEIEKKFETLTDKVDRKVEEQLSK